MLVVTTEVRTTTCYMCACRCGIRVHVDEKDGRAVVRYIEGNPEHPLNKGVICAKGASGIMKQLSPARLTHPLRRKKGSERGAGEFEKISWDEAFSILETRLKAIRASDPKKFALFTGRDQMQALTGLFARQFGTPNYAAHGGFCSVNMAAGMIYTIGGSFWEFGGPDLERAKLFVMLGTAEDHHSNPLKIAISAFKRRGGRFVSINPVRTGYSAIADEWVPIRPGTDGALLLALNNEIIAQGLYDRAFVARYTNGGQLVVVDPASPRHGLLAVDEGADPVNPLYPQNQLWWDRHSGGPVLTHTPEADPFLFGDFRLADGTRVQPAFQLLADRLRPHTPEWAEKITGVPASTIRRLAHEMGVTARDEKIELPIAWTDCWGNEHQTVTGNPVAFHAMRGLAAHSNGFHTVRSLAILMSLLGTIDRPGGFRHKAPFPRAIPPSAKTPTGPEGVQPDTPLAGLALGWPGSPEDLFVDADGKPVRIDKAFSWEYPLSVHGLMHNVITNAWRGDPYPTRHADDLHGQHGLELDHEHGRGAPHAQRPRRGAASTGFPFLVVCDAFQSEMTAFADLVLPDTTYLERHDVMSMLDRPISEFDGPVDSVRVPVVPPTGECKPFQEVLIELASRLRLSGVHEHGRLAQIPRLPGLHRPARDRARLRHRLSRRLARRRRHEIDARRAQPRAVGALRREQLRLQARAAAVLPLHAQLEPRLHGVGAARAPAALGRAGPDPPVLGGAAALPPRGAGQMARTAPAAGARQARGDLLRSVAVLFFSARAAGDRPRALSARGDHAATDGDVPLVGFAERLAAADPRAQLPVHQPAHRARERHRGRRLAVGGIAVGQGPLHGPLQRSGRVGDGLDLERDRQAARRLGARAGGQRGAQGVSAEPPHFRHIAGSTSNSDPITGQAGWYDVRVRIYPAAEQGVSPEFRVLEKVPA